MPPNSADKKSIDIEYVRGGALVYVPRNTRPEAPISLTAIQQAAGRSLNWRTLIVLEEGAEAEVWERYLSAPTRKGRRKRTKGDEKKADDAPIVTHGTVTIDGDPSELTSVEADPWRPGSVGAPVDGVEVTGAGHHLVPRHEREAHDGLEVARAAAVDGGQVRAADPREAGPQSGPVRGG